MAIAISFKRISEMKKVFLPILILSFVAVGAVVVFFIFGGISKGGNYTEYNKRLSGQTVTGSLPGIENFDAKLLKKLEAMRKIRISDCLKKIERSL